jgi:hypothetical protein
MRNAGAGVGLYWLPLGAGGWFVRLNGRAYEAAFALRERRPRRSLYHSALVVAGRDGRFVIESAPVRRGDGRDRGRRVRGRGRCAAGRPLQSVPLRAALLARRCDSRCRRGCREPSEAHERPRRRRSPARARAARADSCLGPRRARCRRHVELELDRRVARRARRTGCRVTPSAGRRTSTRLAGRRRRRVSCNGLVSDPGARTQSMCQGYDDGTWRSSRLPFVSCPVPGRRYRHGLRRR